MVSPTKPIGIANTHQTLYYQYLLGLLSPEQLTLTLIQRDSSQFMYSKPNYSLVSRI